MEEAAVLLKKAGFSLSGISNGSRKLIFEYPRDGIKY
jgi:hypothetical protein